MNPKPAKLPTTDRDVVAYHAMGHLLERLDAAVTRPACAIHASGSPFSNVTVLHALADAAQRPPDLAAFSCDGETLTYR